MAGGFQNRERRNDPTTLVLFGATSDLARGRLWPALHDLAASGRLPAGTGVLGISG
jgi:glucose-6-phosphate 1-dehydrogenase